MKMFFKSLSGKNYRHVKRVKWTTQKNLEVAVKDIEMIFDIIIERCSCNSCKGLIKPLQYRLKKLKRISKNEKGFSL